VIPALRAALRSTFDALKESGRSGSPGQSRQRMLGALVVAQFALALMLSVGAGLLLRSFARLLGTSPGFRAEQLVTASVQLPSGRYATGPQIKAFYQQAVDASRAIPRVAAAATSTDRPLRVLEWRTFTPDSTAQPLAQLNRVIAATWTAASDSVKPQRFSMTVVGLFAIVALALAAIGIYGVLANAVSQQTHEIGVRMALGAQGPAVMWSVLRRALVLMAFGVTIGALGALALTRLMAGLLYEIRPTDATAFAVSALLLAALAVAASLVPAWRATRVDPLVALRAE
jgi:ABC-type antimicrobial peptide transport system permease subunit